MATLKQKQVSVLAMNTMAFAVNFAVWVMFSVIERLLQVAEREFKPLSPCGREVGGKGLFHQHGASTFLPAYQRQVMNLSLIHI